MMPVVKDRPEDRAHQRELAVGPRRRDRRLQPARGAGPSGYRITDGQQPRRADGADPRGQGRAQPAPGSAPGQGHRGRDAGRPRRRRQGARGAQGRRRGAHVRWQLKGTPKMAITGNKFLVRDGRDPGRRRPRDAPAYGDRHRPRRPRRCCSWWSTAGRAFSRGYTMVELANRMIELGADEALNLDGGGSSTMMAKGRGGLLKVINSPVRRRRSARSPTASRSPTRSPLTARLAESGDLDERDAGDRGEALRHRVGDLARPDLGPSVGHDDARAGRYVAPDRDRRGRQPARRASPASSTACWTASATSSRSSKVFT